MNISFFVPYFQEGGVETTVCRLAAQFADRGHDVDLLTFGHENRYIDDTPFTLVDLGASRTLASLPGLVRYLYQQVPDALLSVHYFANVVSVAGRAAANTDTVLILTERINISHVFRETESWKYRILPKLMRLSYPRADARVAVSQDAAADLAQFIGMPERSVSAIYNPTLVDEVFEKATEPVDHPWFDADVPVLLGVGRLTDQKDFTTLLQAFSRLTTDLDARLLVLGEGENRNQLERLATELDVSDTVAFPGFVDNPYKYIRAADLFVLSSRFEGMPNVLVEAAAIGTPIVATDCPSGPRELLQDGATDALIPVGDPERMAETIEHQLANPEKAQRQIERLQPKLDQFRPDVACDEYLSLIEGASQ